MTDKSGWGQVDCATRDRFWLESQDRLVVFSSLTDPDGQYGPGVVYTEWGAKDGEKPWLRDYYYTGAPCTHYMPVANIAWPAGAGRG
jgi:hypothetical protein